MAKKSSLEKNNLRRRIVAKDKKKRSSLKSIIMSKTVSPDQRIKAVIRLSQMRKDGSPVRVRNRCEITGRPRGYYRKFKLSRVMIRELGNAGAIAGLVKSSW